MSVTVEVDPNVTALLRTIGLLDADGHVVAGWFEDPLASVGRILSDATQRDALLALLDDFLPPDELAAPAGSAWHPLLDPSGRGNVYLTVTGSVIGLAAQLATSASASARAVAGLRLGLVDTAEGLTPIAGTAAGPLELAFDVELDPPATARAVGVRAAVDVESAATFSVRLEDVDVGAGPQTLEVSSASLGRDLVLAFETLARDALANLAAADPKVARAAEHLLGALGLDGALPRLPLERLIGDPAALRGWLAQIAGDPASLQAWFGHLAGLLGASTPTAANPLSATVASLGGGVDVTLRAEVAGAELRLVVGLAVPAGSARLDAAATLLAVPLDAGTPVRLVPDAAVRIRAPAAGGPLVDAAPELQVGAVAAGLRFDGTALTPELVLGDVMFRGVDHGSLDLTNAAAVGDVAADALEQAIKDALGEAGPARAILALLGILPPRGDPGTPHRLDVLAFTRAPTRALADLHRTVLADGRRWAHMFAELGSLLGLSGPAAGSGADADPWRLRIAAEEPLELDLAAWDAQDASTPAGERRLRIGLVAAARVVPWSTVLRTELLTFDLPPDGPAAVRVIGEQRLSLVLAPVPDADTTVGVAFALDALRAVAAWRPGAPLAFTARAEGVRVSAGGDQVGPLTLVFPPTDPAAPDLGLGASIDELLALLRLLARHAVQAWGGDAAYALGDLIGLYHGGDDDWPLLEPPDATDLGSLLARPGDALRRQAGRLAGELGADGEPYARRALSALAGILRDRAPRARDGFAPRLDVRVTGAGTYSAPWALPLSRDPDAVGAVELLVWLEPGGPPGRWAPSLAARAAAAADAGTLVAFARELDGFLPGLSSWPDAEMDGDGLERLGEWLASGDGVVPLDSQLPGLPGWTEAAVLTGAHDDQPRDAAAIERIAAQLQAWADEDGGRAVLLLGPPWSDHGIWSDLLAVVEPNRVPGTHFDLRGGADPAAVIAVATHYTADLDDRFPADPAALAVQIGTLVDRVIAITGRARVALVAHSTAGVAARVLAGSRPDAVRGLVTLGTPHAGAAPAPLVDPRLAEAVRAARRLAGDALAPTPTGKALDRLDAALDGAAGGFSPSAFVPAPGGTPSWVPGLALGSALGGRLAGELARALASRIADAAARPEPTHIGIGARVRLPFPAAAGIAADARIRLDAGRIRLVADAAEPALPSCAASAAIRLERPDGWLVGEPAGPGPRIRAAEIGMTLTPAGTSVTATPQLVLRDVVLGASRRDIALGDAGMTPALDALAAALGAVPAGTPESAVLAIAQAAGVLTADPAGRLHADADGLTALASSPRATLLARREALLDALQAALGGSLEFTPTGLPLAVSVDRATWALRLRSLSGIVLGEAVAAALDARLDLTRLQPGLDASLSVGTVTLAFSSATGQLTLAAPPRLAPLVVAPQPDPAALRAALAPLACRVALSSALSAALSGMLRGPGTVGPLDALLDDPGAWLARLDGDDVHAILRAAARALGVDDSRGLALPGGLVLSAAGPGLRLSLGGTHPLGPAGDALTVGLALDVDAARRVTGGGSLAVDVGLPGGFGRVAIEFSAGVAGAVLVVTPAGGSPITLLPHFSGFGALLAGATALFPQILQAIVDELHPSTGPPTGPLGGALALASTLGIWADDADGFETPERAARLAAMLQPGWLESQAGSAENLAGIIAGLFGSPPLLQPPAGTVSRAGDRVVWTAALPGGGEVRATVRLGAAGPPAVTITVEGFDAGPVVIESAHAGYDGALVLALSLRLDPGGEIAFLTPLMELGASPSGMTAAVLPLGAARRADLALDLAPAPALTVTSEGALALVVDWAVPLVSGLLLRALDGALDDDLWTGGPSARQVAEGAGLVIPGSSPARLEPILPTLDALLIGALRTLARGVTVAITPTLSVGVVNEGARSGLRLEGRQEIPAGDLVVSLRFGAADWVHDEDAGVTLWLLDDNAVTPALSVTGLGAIVSGGTAGPLVDGVVRVEAAGGLLFLDVSFLDAARAPALTVAGLGAGVQIDGGQLVLDASDGDSLVQNVLPPELPAPFDLVVASRDGRLTVEGGHRGAGPGLEIAYPLELDLLLVRVTELVLAVRSGPGRARVEAALSADASLGPLYASITRVGVAATFGEGGTGLGFRAPDGVALSIDSEVASGAGFLLRDDAAGQYSGVFELTIAETISVKVIGLISTKLPDGRPGFALLIIITAEGFTPIQLGMGFVLTGIGGMLALNRTVELDTVRGGLRNGLLDSVLFPQDPVRNAGRLITTVNRVFPQAPDRLLIGPMATIGWGSPTVVTVRLAVLLELPEPLRLIVLASLSALLPDEKEPILQLRVDAVGVLDFKRGELSLDASIHDSRILKFALTGDLALRLRWKEEPQFLLSAGGFHPRYAAPPGFPRLDRIALTLTEGDNPRLRFECYFAITSNSIQFGAHVELFAAAAGFELAGNGGFDALIQWSPFQFSVDVYARLGVRFGGRLIMSINLELGLTGPDPWRARGIAEVEILFIKARVSFALQIGEDRTLPLPEEIDARELLWTAVTDPGNWGAALPAAARPGVTLRRRGGEGVLAHPLATVTVRQRVVPLETPVSRLGAHVPKGGPTTYRVAVEGAATERLAVLPLSDRFALGQFQDRTDDQRLTGRDFVDLTAGYAVSAERETSAPRDRALDSRLTFETLQLSEHDEPAVPGGRSPGLPGEVGLAGMVVA